jgi:hypothetical protein
VPQKRQDPSKNKKKKRISLHLEFAAHAKKNDHSKSNPRKLHASSTPISVVQMQIEIEHKQYINSTISTVSVRR